MTEVACVELLIIESFYVELLIVEPFYAELITYSF